MSASNTARDEMNAEAPRMFIPIAIAEDVADEAFEQTAFNDFGERQVTAGRSIFGTYPPSPEAEVKFVALRREKGR